MKMELLDKTSTPAYKRCSHCGEVQLKSEFFRDCSKPSGYANQCKQCCATYGESEAGRATSRRYKQSERGKETRKRYDQSEKGKLLAQRRYYKYRHSPKGYATQDRYRKSLNGRVVARAWLTAHPDYQMERYYRQQDEILAETGIFCTPRDFYPLLGYIKAFETAEIIDI